MEDFNGDREAARERFLLSAFMAVGGDAGVGVERFCVADPISDGPQGWNGVAGGTEGLVRGGASRERKVN
jgi:hypothetical protein